MSAKAYDKTGREIMAGDTLKLFHFVAALRRKRCYMYKYVEAGPTHEGRYLRISHLNPKNETYLMLCDNKRHDHIEIVQGYGADGTPHDQRKPISLTP